MEIKIGKKEEKKTQSSLQERKKMQILDTVKERSTFAELEKKD